MLQRCQTANITISKKKLEIGTDIELAGHIISPGGIKPDPTKYAAIRNFPTPTCIRDLRAFLGLANQLGSFIPDLAHLTSGIRPLLHKGVAWTWLEEHQKTFDMIKEILLTWEYTVKPFNPEKSMVLLTDASRLHGIGFALVQRTRTRASTNPVWLQFCNTHTATIRHNRGRMHGYKMGHKEMYILPTRNTIIPSMDGPPTSSRNLPDNDNPRLLNFREKVQNFNFEVRWVAGKTHYIADALSQFPVFEPDPNNEAMKITKYTMPSHACESHQTWA